MEDIIRGKIVGATQITGRVCASSISAGDYTITINPIEGGYRLSVTRGGDVQTMDVLDGVGIVGVEKTGSTGDVDSYRITFTDGSTFDYTIDTNAAAYAAAELERVAAENVRKAAETSRTDAELARESADTARARAEDGRQSAEAARVTGEQNRASAESGRVAAENARAETFAAYENRIAEAERTVQSVRDDADAGKFDGKDAPQDAVLYTPQTLTTEQQAQARENVGAASAESVEAVENALPGKLTEPAEGLAVGKYFRVAAIDENGHAVLEAVDAKDVGVQDVQVAGASVVEDGVANMPLAENAPAYTQAKYGLVALGDALNYGLTLAHDNGHNADVLTLSTPGTITIDNRQKTNWLSVKYAPLMSTNLDYAVKAAMCDGKGAEWTADEQAAARERMGLDNWILLADITLDEEVSTIIIPNSKKIKELSIFGTIYASSDAFSGNVGIYCGDYLIHCLNSLPSSGAKWVNANTRYAGGFYVGHVSTFASNSVAYNYATTMTYRSELQDIASEDLRIYQFNNRKIGIGTNFKIWIREA